MSSVETVSHPRGQAEQLPHDRAPLVAVGAHSVALLEVMHQPVCHLVGHHIDEERLAVFTQQHGIETQPGAAEVCLAGALAAQVEPHPRTRQMRMHLPAQLKSGLDALMQRSMQRRLVEAVEPIGTGVGKRWSVHGMLECRPVMAASSPLSRDPPKCSESHDVRHAPARTAPRR